jgi:sugar phosphate isomerase/epimerase
MKVGFASLVGVEPIPFPELVRWSAENRLESIEVNLGPTYPTIGGARFPGHLDSAEIAANGPGPVHELIAEHGVSIHALAPMINLLTADLSLREQRVAYFRTTINACAVLRVPTVVTFAGSAYGMHFYGMPGVGDCHETNRVSDNLRIFKEVYGPLAEYAAQRGVRIAFETAGRGGPEGNIAHSPELWDAMFELVPSPAIGLSFDPSHLVWLQIPNIPDVIRQYGSRIYHVDGKDIEILWGRLSRQGILGSSWWRYRLPGFGALDWTAIISALMDIGYDDVIAIENEDPLFPGLAGVRSAADFLRGRMLSFGLAADGPLGESLGT